MRLFLWFSNTVNLSVYYFWGVNHNMKKEKAVVVLWSQLGRGRKKILHLKGLKRKIPNKWRVNWPAHISFIRHAFKIQQRVYFRGLEEQGNRKKKAFVVCFFNMTWWICCEHSTWRFSWKKKLKMDEMLTSRVYKIMSECIRKPV